MVRGVVAARVGPSDELLRERCPSDVPLGGKKMGRWGKFPLSEDAELSTIYLSDRANVARGTISREGVGLGEPIEADGLNREEVVL